MLVLARKLGEKILIGDDITITVVDIGKSKVKLGIKAPAGHHILRSELVVDTELTAARNGADAGVVKTEKAPNQPSRIPWAARTAETVGA